MVAKKEDVASRGIASRINAHFQPLSAETSSHGPIRAAIIQLP